MRIYTEYETMRKRRKTNGRGPGSLSLTLVQFGSTVTYVLCPSAKIYSVVHHASASTMHPFVSEARLLDNPFPSKGTKIESFFKNGLNKVNWHESSTRPRVPEKCDCNHLCFFVDCGYPISISSDRKMLLLYLALTYQSMIWCPT